MKQLLLLVVTVAAALGLAAAAHAGTTVHANGKTYVPAHVAYVMDTPTGSVPQVTIPSNVPYYATKPPTGTTVRVYDPTLKYVVWVPLAAAIDKHWYVPQPGGISAGWLGVAVIALGLGGGLIYAFRKKA